MLPRVEVEEVRIKKCSHELKFKLFGYEFRFMLDLSQTLE